jgi:hypothetical protein
MDISKTASVGVDPITGILVLEHMIDEIFDLLEDNVFVAVEEPSQPKLQRRRMRRILDEFTFPRMVSRETASAHLLDVRLIVRTELLGWNPFQIKDSYAAYSWRGDDRFNDGHGRILTTQLPRPR